MGLEAGGGTRGKVREKAGGEEGTTEMRKRPEKDVGGRGFSPMKPVNRLYRVTM